MHQVGNARFDPATGDLRSATGVTRLAPLTAKALSLLLCRAGELVTRRELTAALWPGEEFGLSDRLNYCIHQLRDALKKVGAADAVETVPRRGYRFHIPATIATAQIAGHTAGADSPTRGARSARRTMVASALIACLLFVVAAGWSLASDPGPGAWGTSRHEANHQSRHTIPHSASVRAPASPRPAP